MFKKYIELSQQLSEFYSIDKSINIHKSIAEHINVKKPPTVM